MADTANSEFSRLLPAAGIEALDEVSREITATPEECGALARRLGLEALSDFVIRLELQRDILGDIAVHGHLTANVVQTCVVTLEPVPSRIDDTFDVRFTTAAEVEHDLDIGPDDEEPPESLGDDGLDMGELAAQQLALALDPYPRLPDAQVPQSLVRDPARDGPFAALSRLGTPEGDERD